MVKGVTTSVGKGDPESLELLEDTPHHQRAHGGRGLRGHTHQPGKPVSVMSIPTEHLPWMHEDGGIEITGGLQDGDDAGIIEIGPVDVRADLDTGHAQLVHASLELLDRQIRGLHRQISQAGESGGIGRDHPGDVVVGSWERSNACAGLAQ